MPSRGLLERRLSNMTLLTVLHHYLELRVHYSAPRLLIIQYFALIGVLVNTSGCTLPQWYGNDVAHVATISAIVPLPNVPPYAEVKCLGQSPADSSGATAIIIYRRVGRFRHYFALPVKSEDSWHVGERVRFNETSCGIQAE